MSVLSRCNTEEIRYFWTVMKKKYLSPAFEAVFQVEMQDHLLADSTTGSIHEYEFDDNGWEDLI